MTKLSPFLACMISTVGCSRGLTEVTTRKPEPAFLGELSGLYETTVTHAGKTGFFLPGPRLQILHLTDSSELDDVLIMEENLQFTDVSPLEDDPPDPGDELGFRPRLFIDADFDGTELAGVTSSGEDFYARRVAGGGALTIDTVYKICPSSVDTHPLIATQVCPVNPALSGVYSGTAYACDTGRTEVVGERDLALGFINELLVGLHYGTDLLIEGYYDRAEEWGFGWSSDLESAGDESRSGDLNFVLGESDQLLTLEGTFEVFDYDNCDFMTGECNLDCEEMVLERLSGGQSTDCFAAYAPAVAATVHVAIVEDNDARFLELRSPSVADILDAGVDPEDLPFLVGATLRPAAGGTSLVAIPPSPNDDYHVRFQLGPEPSTPVQYELVFGVEDPLYGWLTTSRCVVDGIGFPP